MATLDVPYRMNLRMITNGRKLALVSLLLLSISTLAACQAESTTQKSRSRNNQPSGIQQPRDSQRAQDNPQAQQINQLVAISQTADDIIDDIDSDYWDGAREKIFLLKEAADNLPTPQLNHPNISLMLLDQFNLYTVQLERYIEEYKKQEAIFAATQLIGITRDLSSRFQPNRPLELGRLSYLAREIRVWADMYDMRMLQIRAVTIHRTWNDLRLMVVSLKGEALAKEMDAVVVSLDKAQTVEEFYEIEPTLLQTVKKLERVFSAQQSPNQAARD